MLSNNTVKHKFKSVLKDFKNYYLTLAVDLVEMLPKASDKYSVSIFIKSGEDMILGDYFNLESVSDNLIITILKATQILKATAKKNLSRRFLRDEVKSLSKPISDLCHLSIISGKFSDSCKMIKPKLRYKKVL